MEQRSRSPATLDAVPNPRPGETDAREAGSLVPFAGVRCPNKKCRKKVAEDLHGMLTITCRHCGQQSTITRE